MCGMCGARTTLIPSQQARASSVAKTPSFSFCQVDMYAQSVQHVVVDCMIHKASDGFAGLRCPGTATRSWLEDLNIDN